MAQSLLSARALPGEEERRRKEEEERRRRRRKKKKKKKKEEERRRKKKKEEERRRKKKKRRRRKKKKKKKKEEEKKKKEEEKKKKKKKRRRRKKKDRRNWHISVQIKADTWTLRRFCLEKTGTRAHARRWDGFTVLAKVQLLLELIYGETFKPKSVFLLLRVVSGETRFRSSSLFL